MTEPLYDCIVEDCERHSFTKRGFMHHIREKHPEFYERWLNELPKATTLIMSRYKHRMMIEALKEE